MTEIRTFPATRREDNRYARGAADDQGDKQEDDGSCEKARLQCAPLSGGASWIAMERELSSGPRTSPGVGCCLAKRHQMVPGAFFLSEGKENPQNFLFGKYRTGREDGQTTSARAQLAALDLCLQLPKSRF